MKLLTRILLSVLVMAACPVHGQSVFNKYGPVAGIQLSNGLTYQNTAATSSDVVDLFGTTANSFLATPNGSTGVLALRSIVGADLPPINLASTANGGVSSSSILLGTNGGTSNGFFSVVGPTTSLKTFTFPNASATVLTTNAAVTVPQGGTGLATLTAHGVMLGEGTSSPSFVTMGADTVLLGAASADPTAAALTNCGDSSHAVSYSTSSHAFGCQTLTTGGSVTNVASGTGLTGGPITTTGTLSVDQAFTPTWTGLHIFDAGGGTTPSVRIGTTGAQGILCVGNSSTCNSNPTSGDPAHTIELVDNGGALQGIRLLTYASGANAISPLHWARANGTQASPTAIVSNDNILSIGARGYTGSAMSGSAIAIEGIATENWSGTALGSKLQFEVVPNTGTTRVPVFAMIATSSASNPSMITNGTGGTSVGFMPVIDAAGTRYGYWGKASGSNNDISYESDAGLRLTANNGADPMHIGVSGETKVNFNGVDMTPLVGTYTATYTGFSTGQTATASYYKIGVEFCTTLPAVTATSNATTFTITGLPAAAQITTVAAGGPANTEDGTVVGVGSWGVTTGATTITMFNTNNTSVWTASGTKGLTRPLSICWPTN